MRRAHAIAGVLGVCAAWACTTSNPPDAHSDATPVEASPVASPQTRTDLPAARRDLPPPAGTDDVAQWTCTDDADCTMTCALGSVSKAWIDTRPNADDCDDGCGWSSGQEKCQQGQCVAVNEDGTINASCTRRSQ